VPWPLVGHALKEIIDLTQSPQRSRSFLGSSVFICGSPASACQRGILPGSFPPDFAPRIGPILDSSNLRGFLDEKVAIWVLQT